MSGNARLCGRQRRDVGQTSCQSLPPDQFTLALDAPAVVRQIVIAQHDDGVRTSSGDRKVAVVVWERGWLLRSDGLDQPKLGQRGHAVVEADLLDDLAVDHLQ